MIRAASAILAGVGLLACLGSMQQGPSTRPATPDNATELEFRLSDRLADLQIEDGRVILDSSEGPQALDGEEFLRVLEARQRGERRGRLYRLFDITGGFGLIWIAIGFGGQFLFAGRMLVQWLASERKGQSVVPPAFWWMSLVGATMLLAYFIWRRDVVGIFGQALGWSIYARNLWLIHRIQPATAA